MKGISASLSCLLVFAGIQPSSAVQWHKLTYRFAKPGVSYAAFQNGRHACLKGNLIKLASRWAIDTYSIAVAYNPDAFRQWMMQNGYALAPKGFRVSFRFPQGSNQALLLE